MATNSDALWETPEVVQIFRTTYKAIHGVELTYHEAVEKLRNDDNA